MTDQQTSRTNITEALDREEARLVRLAQKHGDVGPGSVGLLIDLTNVHGSFEAIRHDLAAEPRSDAVTAQDEPSRPVGITDDQLYTAEDIASATGYGHSDKCQVWWEDPDGCDCELRYAIADGLKQSGIVALEQEMGWDPTTRRGERVVRREFNPMPGEARAASASVPPFGASKANPFTKKIDVVADTPEQGK